ncbi:hypothetical protein ACPB9E_10940 [Streptomyces exfoliatus]
MHDVGEPVGACGCRQEQRTPGVLRKVGQVGGEQALEPRGERE